MGTQKNTPTQGQAKPQVDHHDELKAAGYADYMRQKQDRQDLDEFTRSMMAANLKPRPDVTLTLSQVGSIHDRLMTGASLALALHRQAQTERDGGMATPAELILWQVFTAVLDAAENLGHAAGMNPEESRVE